MSMSDLENDPRYPWIKVEHRPPSPKPKKKKDPNKKPKDLNKGPIPTAYRVRIAKDGTKWHSIIDILRPNSPPVEWPEYPDRPLEDDFPQGMNTYFEQLSDWDLEDPECVIKKLGIPERERFKLRKKKKRKMPKDLEKLEAKLNAPDEFPNGPPCGIPTYVENPELIEDDSSYDNDTFDTVGLYPATGYGGGLTDKPPEDDSYYPESGEMDVDSGEISSYGYNMDREKMWKELQAI
ncbi:uncharacterized protein LOC129001855 [Macrosteles quadrilineatus]|uniref:uncharacterized protein LOC129001855 n=1 Tax=Macrosteles quadrilineatus TaxID=74068 RepID=UPI0023E30B31|nr:uncharacterized protein LOC129001855 [Macrosteles quadrilineatus]